MVEVAWLVAIVALIGLAQFAVYRYVGSRGEAAFDPYAVDGPAYASVAAAVEEAEGGRRCPRCGTVNEPDYTFCRDCTGRLGV